MPRAPQKPSRALKAGKTEMIKGARKKPRARPGTKALREIAGEQRDSYKRFAIPRAPFERLCREVAGEQLRTHFAVRGVGGSGLNWDQVRFSERALEALQNSAEAHMVGMFEGAKDSHCKNKRITTFARDIHEEAQKMGILPPPMPWKDAAVALAERKKRLAAERKAAEARRQQKLAAEQKKKPKGMRQSTGKDPKPAPAEEDEEEESSEDESSAESSGSSE